MCAKLLEAPIFVGAYFYSIKFIGGFIMNKLFEELQKNISFVLVCGAAAGIEIIIG